MNQVEFDIFVGPCRMDNDCAGDVGLGAVHKVRHARGGGVREGVTVCDREEGVQEHVTSHFSNFFIHMEPKIESDV